MKQQLRGRKIFGDAVAGSIATLQDPGAGSILVAKTLTPSVVRALTDNHIAVITSRGGFACHGANVLRVLRKHRSKNLTWITDLPDDIRLVVPGTECEILRDGTVGLTLNEPINEHGKEHVGELVGLLTTGTRIRCYWPDRVYDRFSASLMVPGLSEDIRELGFDVTAVHGPDQLIWFVGESPTFGRLLEAAQFSSDLCKSTMDRQVKVYASILCKLRVLDLDNLGLDTLVDICRAYFSCFLLHHRTYSDVLARALLTHQALAQPQDAVQSLIERLLCTDLVQWYSMLPGPLLLRKDFVEESSLVPLPPFTPGEELSRAEENLAVKIENTELPYSTHKTLRDIARLCILKEWKFILIKIITSRLADRLRRLSMGAKSIRMRTIEEVLMEYRALKETY